MSKGLLRSLILFLSMSIVAPGWGGEKPKRGAGSSIREMAVSLRVLQKDLQDGQSKGVYPPGILQLDGLTSITSIMVDYENRDVVLKGISDPSLPPLHLDDFVVALRNAWGKYVKTKWTKQYYYHPGCSIDPDPEVMQSLDQVLSQKDSAYSPEKFQEKGQIFHKICESPQQVRIEGVPFDTRFAWIMVKADYDLKKISNGSDNPKVPGLINLSKMTVDYFKKKVAQEKLTKITTSVMCRFWFHPGEQGYLEDKGVVAISKCSVKLLTEEQHLSKTGEILGTGRADPLAQKFATTFTALYPQVAKSRPIYAELENLFLFVAVAKTLWAKKFFEEAKLDIDYLLNQYPVGVVNVKREVPGCSRFLAFETRNQVKGRRALIVWWYGICGGVAIAIDAKDEDFIAEKTGALLNERLLVLEARPNPETRFWEIIFR